MRRALATLAFALGTAPAFAAADVPCDDPSLSEAAAEIALVGASIDGPALVDLSREFGSNAVGLRVVQEALAGSAGATLLDEAVAREGEALVVCGEAVTETRRVRIVGRSGARLTAALTGRGWAVDVELRPGVAGGELVVRGPDGTSLRRAVTRASSHVLLPDSFGGRFVAQLLGSGPAGPLPLAELSRGVLGEGASPGESVASHVARLRRSAGVASLRPNTILDRVAASQAAVVCRAGRPTHDDDGLDPVERVARAGLEARIVGEVVGRGTSRPEVLSALDDSPSHRLELETPEHTDFGVGEHVEAGHTCIVVVLASFPRFAGR